MKEDNVEQRFPDGGDHPEKGKPTQKETPAERKTEGREEKTDSGQGEDGRMKRRTAPRPRISRKVEPHGSSEQKDITGSSGGTPEASSDSSSQSGITERDARTPVRDRQAGRYDDRHPSERDRYSDRSGERRPYDPGRYSDRSGERRPYDPGRASDRGGERRLYDPNRYPDRGGERRGYDPNRYPDRGEERRGYAPNRYPDRSEERRGYDPNRYDQRPSYPQRGNSYREGGRPPRQGGKPAYGRPQRPQKARKPRPLGPGEMYAPPPHPEGIRINRYIANAGVCSRRDADKLVEAGEIKVNGVVVDTLGARIDPGDVVTYKGVVIKGEKLRYILLNKPKGYITSNDDPEGRSTVMELLEDACEERVFPVGRLDRNTTGLLLFTNDGILAEKLMHPRNLVKKLYHIQLDRPLDPVHMKKISNGLKLEDGWIKADQISYAGTTDDRSEIGLEIHSGKNRIVRRIFEHLGYEVIKLDRVMFAGLTKKDLRRGKWRNLLPEELNFLNML